MARFYGSEIDGGGADLGTINVTPDVTPASSGEMTREERLAQIKSEREGAAIAAAVQRALDDPKKDPTQKPEGEITADYINYWSWIGGGTSGRWKEYTVTNNQSNLEIYGPRTIGGDTQGNYGTSDGANSLVTRPVALKDQYGNIIGWQSGDGTTVTTADTTATTVTTTPNTTKPNTTTTVVTTTPVTTKPVTTVTSTAVTTNPATTVATTNVMTSGQQDIYSIIVDRLNRYNLGSLAPLIKKLAIEGATEATIMLRLQDEPLYQERFKANQSRISKGLKVLTPSEYLTLEDDYRQVLRAYGLKQFDNDAYVSQFLANDISVSELSNRVVTAVQRVRNADPAVSAMLKNYYGISNNDLVAYVLDPNQQFQKIERQIAASEIGVAAGRQGFNIGVPVAEQLAAQGISQAEAQKGYATIADILPTAEKLSDIYGKTLEGYGLAEGEQEVFNQLASAQRKRQRLTQREVAEFSGQSGVGRTSLGGTTRGQF